MKTERERNAEDEIVWLSVFRGDRRVKLVECDAGLGNELVLSVNWLRIGCRHQLENGEQNGVSFQVSRSNRADNSNNRTRREWSSLWSQNYYELR